MVSLLTHFMELGILVQLTFAGVVKKPTRFMLTIARPRVLFCIISIQPTLSRPDSEKLVFIISYLHVGLSTGR